MYRQYYYIQVHGKDRDNYDLWKNSEPRYLDGTDIDDLTKHIEFLIREHVKSVMNKNSVESLIKYSSDYPLQKMYDMVTDRSDHLVFLGPILKIADKYQPVDFNYLADEYLKEQLGDALNTTNSTRKNEIELLKQLREKYPEV